MAVKKKVSKTVKKETKKVAKKTTSLSKPKKTINKAKPATKKPVVKKATKAVVNTKKVVKKPKKEEKPQVKKALKAKTVKKATKPVAKKLVKAKKVNNVKASTVKNTKKPKLKAIKKVENTKKLEKEPINEDILVTTVQQPEEIDSRINDLEQRILEKEIDYYKTAYKVYKNKHQKGIIRQMIMIIVAVAAIVLSVFLGISLSVSKNAKPIENVVQETENEGLEPKKEVEKIHDFINLDFKYIYEDYKSKAYKPEDYVGQIIFESSIINEPIFQGSTNDTYLRRDWQTFEYRNDGPIFMDVSCDSDFDKNIVLYGHNTPTYLDPDQDKLFTPLHLFEDPENYDDNKYLYLALENRVEMYEVASVYQINIVQDDDGVQYLADDEPLYYLNNYTSKQFDTYKTAIEDRQYYDTYVEFDEGDKILTLQTCNENDINKLIVVAKMLDIMYY